jgi:hypothetical protein
MITLRVTARSGAACSCVLLFACALLLKPAQDRIDAEYAATAADPDLLYFGSPRIVNALALGYEGLLADIYWMRSIQYYGRRGEADRRPVRYKNLAALLDITTTLDPMLISAYRAGSNFLAEEDPVGAGQPAEAIRLLDKGIAMNPGMWRLYFDKGFIYFWFIKDFSKAGETWLAGSRLPGAPHWMHSMAAMGMSRGGAVETARELWRRQYNESDRADVKSNARNHLDSLQVDEDLWTLEFFIEKYAKAHGDYPGHLQELVRAGYIRGLPMDPSGTPYEYDPSEGKAKLAASTKVRYVKVAYDYRKAFMDNLATRFSNPTHTESRD